MDSGGLPGFAWPGILPQKPPNSGIRTQPRAAVSGTGESALSVSSTRLERTSRTPGSLSNWCSVRRPSASRSGHNDPQQEIHLAGHRVRGDRLRAVRPAVRRNCSMTSSVWRSSLICTKARTFCPTRFGIDECRVLFDDSRLFELPDSARAGRGRQADFRRDLDMAQAAVVLQQREDAHVRPIEDCSCHDSPITLDGLVIIANITDCPQEFS